MAQNVAVRAAGRLTDWISIGVLASSVPRDTVDEAIAVWGRQAKRSDGKLPPHVMLWRVKDSVGLPVIAVLGDGSYLSVVFAATLRTPARQRILAAVRAGQVIDERRARIVRVIEYRVGGRGADTDQELICVVSTILDPAQASAGVLAQGYADRWEHETGNDELKTYLRGPGTVLRSHSPDMVRQEIYGYLLTHYAISALVCRAATEADIDPDRVKFLRTVRIVRRRIDDPAAFSP